MPFKVAVIFAGQIRSFKTCWPSIYKHVIVPFEPHVDVFMHLWEFGEDVSEYREEGNYLTQFKIQNDECSKEYVIEKCDKILKGFVCDKWSKEWENKIMEECRGYEIIENMNEHDRNYAVSCICMYYKIMLSNNLRLEYQKENNNEYDLVIRARLDFKWSENVPFMNLKNNQIAFVNDNYAKHNCNDKFFMGTPNVIDTVCQLPYELYDIWNEKRVRIFEGQEVNKWKLKSMGLELIKFGSLGTYEKFVGRHRVSFKHKYYAVNNCLSDLGFTICEILMDNLGIGVVGINKTNICEENERKNLKILKKFENFEFVNEIQSTEKITRFIYINSIDGFENIDVSSRMTEYVGTQKNLPLKLKNSSVKQRIYVEENIGDIEIIKNICHKIYQKKSIGDCSL